MKRLTYLTVTIAFLIGILITFDACKKENENTDEYYVKYEVNSTTIYFGRKLDVTIKTENNTDTTFSVNQGSNWETIIGPVQKGFNATLKVTAISENNSKLRLYTNLYVSKNNSPFALKNTDGSDTPRDSVELSYTIDY